MIRIWFNHWFSTSYHLIELMRKGRQDEVRIIASNKQIHSVIQQVCDEWYQDSLADGEEYIQYCLEFCKEHRIDVFVPRRKMVEISREKARFEEIGIKVMVDDYEMLRILNDKAAAYDFFRECPEIHIPDYEIVNTAEQFEAAYGRLRENHGQVCVKFVQDEGAMSYRRLTEQVDRFRRLRVYPGAEIAYEEYLGILREAGRFDDLMMMPYLPGREISVDCLGTDTGLIAIPRWKTSARHEEILFDKEILRMAEVIWEKTGLRFPCNIQFKLKGDVPYLLEVNTRMSGGLQMACLAEGINIPQLALDKLLGRPVQWSFEPSERIVSYIEAPQILKSRCEFY